jgi:hypothetical protein
MSQTDVSQLFQDAYDAGELTAGSLKIIGNIGTRFQNALGTPATEVDSSEATLFSILADNTVSLSALEDEVIKGQNLCIDALLATKQASSIMMLTEYYEGNILHPYCLLEDAVRMDRTNYKASLGHTPLYDGTLDLLAAVLKKSFEFSNNGQPVRTVSVVVSDGWDNSSRHSAGDVETVISDMLAQENHIVAGMGIVHPGNSPEEFKKIFKAMGIPDLWIKTPSSDPHEIREAFMMVSQSAVRASQSAGSFSQTAAGGFGVQ